ncbi:hypothetical protein ZIOFF_028227 [Zingiber officinale]|uniref:1,3-beta-glucan synthase component FKS1-like domain-containing protein n=1 Tax=Zingiber officinale TaxID=94328 RepID=A0A8J5GRQ7_ZINOF|nr:hypothetical protein ZIOFF_028227 [Zingiber officinale]
MVDLGDAMVAVGAIMMMAKDHDGDGGARVAAFLPLYVVVLGSPTEMRTPETNWERLVRAALRLERLGVVVSEQQPVSGVAGNVPSSLTNNTHIDEILRAADEIEDEDPNIARILCEHAYSLAQNLDPNSEGRGVLQFKTGLMSVIKQKLAKRDGRTIDRSQDIARLQEFYKHYREKNKVDELREDEMKMRESGVFSGNLGDYTVSLIAYALKCSGQCTDKENLVEMLYCEPNWFDRLERKTLKRKKVFATLRVLGTVLEELTREMAPDAVQNLISEEMKRVMEKDAAMTEDVIPYNIIPLDTQSITNAIVNLPEASYYGDKVKAAILSLKYYANLPKLPSDFSLPATRSADVLDLLHYVFGFQKDNVSNQREHIVHLLANEQSRFGCVLGSEPKIDETAVTSVFKKSLENYTKWCNYLPLQPVWNNMENLSREKKLLYVSLYFLIWGEAANIRFLPECLCYIFHHMARELEEILRQPIAQSAKSCISPDGVSFLSQLIFPLYDVIAAGDAFGHVAGLGRCIWAWGGEMATMVEGEMAAAKVLIPGVAATKGGELPPKAPHLLEAVRLIPASRLHPPALGAEAANNDNGRAPHSAWRNYDDFNEFFWSLRCFQLGWPWMLSSPFFTKPSKNTMGLTIIAFNNGVNSTTIKQVLSLGPTYVVMKFIESVLDILMMYGAFSTSRRSAVTRIFGRFLWFSVASFAVCYFYISLFLQIKPLVSPTKTIVNFRDLQYSWHDLMSRNNHNALTILSLWAPVFANKLICILCSSFLLQIAAFEHHYGKNKSYPVLVGFLMNHFLADLLTMLMNYFRYLTDVYRGVKT